MNVENELIKLLNKCDKIDIPVSCLIVRNNKIISKAYNNKYKKNNIIGHAEINAIIKASKKLHRSNLNDCIMYVTLKPCKMCQSIIQESRMKKVFYYIENDKNINDTVNYIKLENNDLFKNKILNFFKDKR